MVKFILIMFSTMSLIVIVSLSKTVFPYKIKEFKYGVLCKSCDQVRSGIWLLESNKRAFRFSLDSIEYLSYSNSSYEKLVELNSAEFKCFYNRDNPSNNFLRLDREAKIINRLSWFLLAMVVILFGSILALVLEFSKFPTDAHL